MGCIVVFVAQKVGVVCKNCGTEIEIEDDYIPGIQGAEVTARFYGSRRSETVDVVNRSWQRTLTCGNPSCGRARDYGADDLVLFEE
jgi:hypothetical protein